MRTRATSPFVLTASVAFAALVLPACGTTPSGGASTSSSGGGFTSSSGGSSSGTDTAATDGSVADTSSSGANADSSGSETASSGGDSSGSSGADAAVDASTDAVKVDAGPPPPKWIDVYAAAIINKKLGCTGSFCHGGTAVPYTLTGNADKDYTLLMNGVAKNSEKAKCVATKYVVPGEPEQSLLYLKIKKGAVIGCGDPMPPVDGGLDDAISQQVHDWIKAGAKQD